MCQLCQHRSKQAEWSVLQEVFHELEMETAPTQMANATKASLPPYRLPWRERRAQRAGTPPSQRESSLLGEVLQNL